MSEFDFFERAFHPDSGFGLGGMGFTGDNRGFSFMQSSTSRVWAKLKVDTSRVSAVFNEPNGSEFIVKSEPSHAPVYLFGREEKYETEDTRPHGHAYYTAGQQAKDSPQTLQVRMKTWGKNHAFPTEYISNTLTRSVVPSLDITIEIYALIDRHRGLMSIQSTLKGDGFPNSEVFIYDSARTPLMLNTHHRFGNAAGQLVGDHKHILSSTLITVGINADACFIGPVHAKRCVDFKPWDHDLLAGAGTTDFSLANWNGLHLARNPSELDSLGLDTDDSLPIPGVTHMWPRSRKNGSSLWPKEVQSSDLDGWNH